MRAVQKNVELSTLLYLSGDSVVSTNCRTRKLALEKCGDEVSYPHAVTVCRVYTNMQEQKDMHSRAKELFQKAFVALYKCSNIKIFDFTITTKASQKYAIRTMLFRNDLHFYIK